MTISALYWEVKFWSLTRLSIQCSNYSQRPMDGLVPWGFFKNQLNEHVLEKELWIRRLNWISLWEIKLSSNFISGVSIHEEMPEKIMKDMHKKFGYFVILVLYKKELKKHWEFHRFHHSTVTSDKMIPLMLCMIKTLALLIKTLLLWMVINLTAEIKHFSWNFCAGILATLFSRETVQDIDTDQ